jgi:signal transduction histidine kinase
MRQGSKRVKAKELSKRPAAATARTSPKAKVRAGRIAARKEPVRDGSKLRKPKDGLAEALQRQAATDEILRVMSSSPGDVHPVLNAVAERAAGLCDAAFAQVLLVEGNVLRPTAAYWADVGLDKSPGPKRTWPLTRASMSGRAALDCKTIHHADVVPLLSTDYPIALTKQRELGYRAVLVVPLLREGGASGAIFMFRREPRPFSPEQIALVETFARQAVIAIDNARLFNETKERLEQQTATSEILRVISQSPTDVQPVFDAIAAAALKLCNASSAAVLTFDGRLMRLGALANVNPGEIDALRLRYPMSPGRQTAGSRAILTGSTVVVPDVLEDPEFEVRAPSFRSVVSVPLMREGSPTGAITVGRPEPGRFPDQQIALLRTFADQAVIAIENVRLFNETKEALEQQTATSEILGVISRSPRDVQPVFDTIAAAAMRLCRGNQGSVTTYDGELLHLVALAGGVTPEGAEAVRQAYPRPLSRDTASTRAVLTCSIAAISDVLEDPDFVQEATAGGFRSVVGVPLIRDGRPIGAIAVGRPEPGQFSDKQVALLQTFADQAVIAIENVRLVKELELRTGELTRSVGELRALGEVGQAVSSTLDLETVLRTIVSRSVRLADMDGGSIWEYDEAREEFHLHATDRYPAELVEVLRSAPIRKGEGALGRLAVTAEPVEIRNIAEEQNYPTRLREALIRSGYRSVLVVPLLREDHLLGALSVNRSRQGEFDPRVVALLKTFATQSALAIQNARLYREIEIKSRELAAASRHKSEFLANMSHELRTPLNAIIGFSEVLSERMFGEINAKQTEYVSDILQSGQHLLSLINDILDLSKIEAGRMELELNDFDLPGVIENTLMLVRERAVRRGIALERSVDEHLGTIRADERKVKQVLLNLLSNALKFTPEGGKIRVSAAAQGGVAEISVADTGVGIAPQDQETVFEEFRQVGTASKKVEGTGLGLAISRKFIELHGGKIWVTSQVGGGSTFAFNLPLR